MANRESAPRSRCDYASSFGERHETDSANRPKSRTRRARGPSTRTRRSGRQQESRRQHRQNELAASEPSRRCDRSPALPSALGPTFEGLVRRAFGSREIILRHVSSSTVGRSLGIHDRGPPFVPATGNARPLRSPGRRPRPVQRLGPSRAWSHSKRPGTTARAWNARSARPLVDAGRSSAGPRFGAGLPRSRVYAPMEAGSGDSRPGSALRLEPARSEASPSEDEEP